MEENIDTAYIRRAVEASDLAALRVALFQATGDAELAEFGPVATLDDADRARLADRAALLLETRIDGFQRRIPSDEELRELMDMVLGVPTRDEHFEIRRKFLAFTPFPFQHERPEDAAPVPEGFEVAIIGAGPAGISMAVQLGRLGIPYVLYDRRSEIGGTWSIHKYPDIRVDTLSITYEFSFDDEYPWSEYFARGEEVRTYLEFISKKYGVQEHTRLGHDLEDARFDDDEFDMAPNVPGTRRKTRRARREHGCQRGRGLREDQAAGHRRNRRVRGHDRSSNRMDERTRRAGQARGRHRERIDRRAADGAGGREG